LRFRILLAVAKVRRFNSAMRDSRPGATTRSNLEDETKRENDPLDDEDIPF
jgi:hypothetical protein